LAVIPALGLRPGGDALDRSIVQACLASEAPPPPTASPAAFSTPLTATFSYSTSSGGTRGASSSRQ
jgi:hypothetical protein